jgi:Phosphotransferase enzyme family
MGISPTLVPDHHTLAAGLTSVLNSNGYAFGHVILLDRQQNPYTTTCPSEIVTCGFDDGSQLQLFCKYEAGGSHNAYGHRGGLPYEVEVYRQVLQPAPTSTPTFYGAYTEPETGTIWLVLGYLDRGIRPNVQVTWKDYPPNIAHPANTPTAVRLAARWSAHFHAANEARLSISQPRFLKTYDAAYYLGWARRTLLFAGHWHERFPWLATVCERFEDCITPLLAASPTIIHGEFYHDNILIHAGSIFPIDWESAAIAAGEIDLAALTERWPEQIVRDCELEYQRTRWPDGAPSEFERTLSAARVYLHLRWLGDQPDQAAQERLLWRFEHLYAAGRRLGLV